VRSYVASNQCRKSRLARSHDQSRSLRKHTKRSQRRSAMPFGYHRSPGGANSGNFRPTLQPTGVTPIIFKTHEPSNRGSGSAGVRQSDCDVNCLTYGTGLKVAV
jgi:hypothetical protein